MRTNERGEVAIIITVVVLLSIWVAEKVRLYNQRENYRMPAVQNSIHHMAESQPAEGGTHG